MDKLKVMGAMLTFSTIGIFIKNIDLSSSEIAFSRGIIGSVFLLITSYILKTNVSVTSIKGNLKLLVFSGIAMGLNWMFLFEAYKYTTISIATISYYFAPIFVMIASPLLLKEKISLKKVICICLAMIGMLMIVGTNKSSSGNVEYNHLLGIFYGILAAVFYASVIISNKFIINISPGDRTIVQLFVAAIMLIPYILLTTGFNFGSLHGISLYSLLFLGIIHTGLAYTIYFSAIKNLKGQTLAILSYIDPIFAVLISTLFLKESLGIFQIIGAVLILGSTFISEINDK
ncbi:MAG: DMT family transporter [Fusobacterium sp. JB019]|nr:DMT family transporter [Fusobacterium sp. JB019]MDP0506541.1 DMT family transporter [Fusobacterium sp. JB019]